MRTLLNYVGVLTRASRKTQSPKVKVIGREGGVGKAKVKPTLSNEEQAGILTDTHQFRIRRSAQGSSPGLTLGRTSGVLP